MNQVLLNEKIRAANLGLAAVAERISLDLPTFFAKMNQTGGEEFSLGEIRRLKALLGLDSHGVEAIFFGKEVS